LRVPGHLLGCLRNADAIELGTQIRLDVRTGPALAPALHPLDDVSASAARFGTRGDAAVGRPVRKRAHGDTITPLTRSVSSRLAVAGLVITAWLVDPWAGNRRERGVDA
jgi:hypothetical protein